MEVIVPTERTLTQLDHARIARLLTRPGGAGSAGADVLQELLACSDLVASPAVPPGVVTMYTQVLLEDLAGAAPPYQLTVCYPDHAEPGQGFVSVLSPVGVGLLGLREGQVARWRLPGGQAGAARIRAVLFQPEASGDYTT